ncbi:hypothetical protein [Paenibacillus sp. GCM10027626]|uniref:hypothetical protein n=1 Tax=Paenibacillus sp. GCM10027626 TaxID=3273411 RepID=UPI00362CA128
MLKLRNFLLTASNFVGELRLGSFRTKSDFYDKYSQTDTKAGYIIFITSLMFLTIGVISWLTLAAQ